MHTNKLFVILAFLTAPQLLCATHSFYAGTSLNYCSLTGNRGDLAADTQPAEKELSSNKRRNKAGIYGGAFAGYLFRIENFGIGPEFFYNFGKIESSVIDNFTDPGGPTYTTFNVTNKIKNQSGAHIRVGYFLDSYFLYTLLGMQYQTASFEMNAQQSAAGNTTVYSYKPKKKNISAFSFGLGAQKTITENYVVGIECKFANFPRKNFTFNFNDAGETTLTSNFSYKMRSVALKVMYVF
jgi:opacity protein-like surface antigen